MGSVGAMSLSMSRMSGSSSVMAPSGSSAVAIKTRVDLGLCDPFHLSSSYPHVTCSLANAWSRPGHGGHRKRVRRHLSARCAGKSRGKMRTRLSPPSSSSWASSSSSSSSSYSSSCCYFPCAKHLKNSYGVFTVGEPQASLFSSHGLRRKVRMTESSLLGSSGGEVFGTAMYKRDPIRAREGVCRDNMGRYPGRLVIQAVFERFTERAIKSIMLAQREAKAQGRGEVDTSQLLLGLIAEERSNNGFLKTGVTIERARDVVRIMAQEEGMILQKSEKAASEISFSQGSKRVFEGALEESKRMGHNYVAPEHIAVSLLKIADVATAQLLERLGIRKEKMLAEAISRLQGELAKDGRTPLSRNPALAGKSTSGLTASRPPKKEKSALSEFCIDITAKAGEGKIDPVIGREKEVQRVVEILARRTKNNPILLGEPGVGKTAIAEGLAMRIVSGTVPDFLMEKRVLSLDMGLLLAGAKERGELETRVTSLVAEATKSGSVILLIDEVHTLVGSGSVGRGGGNGGGLDIANLLKPALARGLFQCIGATTLDEHRKHIEKDKALARRFQPVMVYEPSEEDTVAILMGLKDRYEQHHNCMFSNAAVESAVHLSSRYIMDRYLPDKAIDLIDEAGSRARINAFKARKDRQSSILMEPPSAYWREIRHIYALRESVSGPHVKATDYDQQKASVSGGTKAFLADIKSATGAAAAPPIDLDAELAAMPTPLELLDDGEEESIVVGPELIAAVASSWSGIPVQQLSADEKEKLLSLESSLRTRVVGQDDAVGAICRAVRRARVGLKDPDRPIAVMMFSGPTGVGKTELTKALAHHYFGSEEAMIRLDMSEYMERHTVSKLMGSPPGYVGYGDGGLLTEAVRRRPFTVVLLDEIEKAHPDVFNILLQIFEDGRLTDSQGRTVSFKNTLIVLTSNVGSSMIAKGGSSSIGFVFEGADEKDGGRYSRLKTLVMGELKSYFRPELLNRLDEVVVFRPLERAQIREIVDMMLRETKGRVSAKGIELEVTEAALVKICDEGYDRAYGARPLRRAVVRLVEDPISEAILAGKYEEGDTALVDVGEDGNTIVTRHPRPDPCKDKVCLPIVKPIERISAVSD